MIQSSFLFFFLSPNPFHLINYFTLEHNRQKLNQANTDVDKNPINLKWIIQSGRCPKVSVNLSPHLTYLTLRHWLKRFSSPQPWIQEHTLRDPVTWHSSSAFIMGAQIKGGEKCLELGFGGSEFSWPDMFSVLSLLILTLSWVTEQFSTSYGHDCAVQIMFWLKQGTNKCSGQHGVSVYKCMAGCKEVVQSEKLSNTRTCVHSSRNH